ncbi:Hypothetical predicted protein [Olea europaea subsp. europaea]|uniref:Homologous recombination OB-fold protein OB-fold domain-containing protein n=1 Tax=Olea europaea subsp. europaea TaxID=158383 RepID=A0A8S0R1Z6_OLEEU|nr:Hypothetical predicted protein [Olea europaea subsp. europaea]
MMGQGSKSNSNSSILSSSFPPKDESCKTKNEMEPWEALDVDDSDLPSLLRPCKRQFRNHPPPSTSIANPFPQSPVSLSSQQEDLHTSIQQRPQPSTSKRISQIPGPAGVVQAAMLRKSMGQSNRNFVPSRDNQMDGDNDSNNGIPTQEYIRRAMEDNSEFDEDFTRNPWFCALEYLGTLNGVIPCTSVSSIKKCLDVGKVDKVVAVIKSCTPNGLGGLIVTLKDPTGTIGASIHQKVLTESEYGKDLTIGAALILQKVSIFKPLRSAHYLNITLRNLIKVFGKENGPPSEQKYSAYSFQFADPGIDYCGKASTTEKMSTLKNRRVENSPVESRQFTQRREDLMHKNNKEKENMLSGSFHYSNRTSINLNAAVKKGALEKVAEDATRTRTQDHHHEFSTVNDERANESNAQGSLINNSPVSNLEVQSTNGVEIAKQQLMVKQSLPQWTDAQLDELFATDDDDGFLF